MQDLFADQIGRSVTVYTASGEFRGTVSAALDDAVILKDAGLLGRTSPDAFGELWVPYAGMSAVRRMP